MGSTLDRSRDARELPEIHGHRRHGLFGPEAEFFVFDEARFHNDQNSAGYHVDSEEGHWNSGRSGDAMNNGFHIRPKEGYVPVALS